MSKTSASPEAIYELGKLYCDRGDFRIAAEKLSTASEIFLERKQFSEYLNCINLLLRIYAEMDEPQKLNATKEKLQDVVLKEKFELTSKTYYTLGRCAVYKQQDATAIEYLEKALALALAKDSKEDICYAINGLAIVYTFLARYDDALKEIYNLQVFFQVLDLPELKLSSMLLNGHILTKTGKYEQALDVYWQCYDLLKTQKNMFMYISLLYAMGIVYAEMNDKDLARLYLGLAKKTADPENHVLLTRRINERLESIGALTEDKYDLVFNFASGSLVEKKKGKVDFKNQFILMDMLRLFVRNPGEVYSKEALVKHIWKQEYDPAVHDNKIYVTIKRLRKMIEPNFDKPKYIFRAKNGYYLNKNAKVLLN